MTATRRQALAKMTPGQTESQNRSQNRSLAVTSARPGQSDQTAEALPPLPADVSDAIVEALVAAILASFQRDPITTDGSPTGTDHSKDAA
jgi:hypothetical protein